jgi:3',5'-cyclic-AMP phosphodiesterase
MARARARFGPVVLVSHAPILTVTGFLESKVERSGGRYVLPSGWMVSEVEKLKELFLRHPRIKLTSALDHIAPNV